MYVGINCPGNWCNWYTGSLGSNGVRVRNAVAMFAVLFVASGSAQVAMELKLVVAAADSMLLFVSVSRNFVGDPLRVRVFTENFEVDRTERMGS